MRCRLIYSKRVTIYYFTAIVSGLLKEAVRPAGGGCAGRKICISGIYCKLVYDRPEVEGIAAGSGGRMKG